MSRSESGRGRGKPTGEQRPRISHGEVADVTSSYTSFRPDQSTTKELEIKITIDDFDTFRIIYDALLAVPDYTARIEQILNTITDVKTTQKTDNNLPLQVTDRKEIRFDGPTKLQEENIRKIKQYYINAKHQHLRYQFAFATESKIPVFNTASATQVRLKLRSSIVIDKFPDWKFDFTIVKSIDKQAFATLKQVKDAFFKKSISPTSYRDNIPQSASFDLKPELEIEYTGRSTPDSIDDILKFVATTIDPLAAGDSEYHTLLEEVATLLLSDKKYAKTFGFKNTLKQLANNPITLDPLTYRSILIPNITNFFLSDKADGERGFVYIRNGKSTTLTSMVSPTTPITSESTTILDVEIIDSKIFAFDILYHNELLTHKDFEERQQILAVAIKPFKHIDAKPQVRLDPASFGKQISQLLKDKTRLYPIDGLIFTPDKVPDTADKRFTQRINYFDAPIYKWKPPANQTIDFLVFTAPAAILGKEPYAVKKGHTLMFLFCGVSNSMFQKLGLDNPKGYADIVKALDLRPEFFPAAFQPSSNPLAYLYYHPGDATPLNGHIVEFGVDATPPTAPLVNWKLHKIRLDRDAQVSNGIGYGNAYKTAELIFESYYNPFTLEKLVDPNLIKQDVYFVQAKQNEYKAMTKFNAFVKAQLLRQLQDTTTVIDLASGKGQDLFTLHGLGITNLIFLDKDREALTELNNRKYNLGQRQFYLFDFKPAANAKVNTIESDLQQPWKQTTTQLEQFGIRQHATDGIIINFAIHYIVEDTASLTNLVDLVDYLLKPGGLFIFTCFDGKRMFDFLKSVKPQKSIDFGYVNPAVATDDLSSPKYSIKRLYKAAEWEPFGLQVGVVHPFSAGEYYTENLIDPAAIAEAFKPRNYTVLQYSSFGDWISKYKGPALDPDDKVYVSLYSYCTIAKNL